MKLSTKQLHTIKKILTHNNVKRAALFGSYARGDATHKSDIDILFEFKGNKSLLDHAGLKITLEESIGKKVDLVTYRSLREGLKPYVMKDLQPLI